MVPTKIEFAGSQGFQLAARMDMPDGSPIAYAMFAHCFTCSKDILAASRISRALSEKGIAVLRFDFTGLGHSDGEFSNTNFSSNVEDLVRAADWLRENHAAPSLLIGHSLGGAAVLSAAASIEEVVGVATIGAPAEPAHVTNLFQDKHDEIQREGKARVNLAGREFTIKQQFVDDLDQHRMEQNIGQLRRALLVFHSPFDEVVSIDNAAAIYKQAKHPKSFVSLDNADHLLTKREDAQYVADVLSAWASRYLPTNGDKDVDGSPNDQKHGTVVVEETGRGKFHNLVTAGEHQMVADEPKKMGGDNHGFTPYELLLAGLGACTSMTLRMYAEHKKLPLKKVKVELQHEKIHASDCESCETETGYLDKITKSIEITGDLTDAQRQRMLEIADRCPVNRTLQSEVLIESTSNK